MVWRELGLNPGLMDNWWTLYLLVKFFPKYVSIHRMSLLCVVIDAKCFCNTLVYKQSIPVIRSKEQKIYIGNTKYPCNTFLFTQNISVIRSKTYKMSCNMLVMIQNINVIPCYRTKIYCVRPLASHHEN